MSSWLRWAAIGLAVMTVGYTAINGCGRSADVAGDAAMPAGGAGGQGGGGTGLDDWGFTPCAEINETATLVQVNMFISVDKSGSMADNNKWGMASAAFSAFFDDPDAAGLNVALRLWPGEGCDQDTCDASICAVPGVPLGSLSDPAHRQALQDEFANTTPEGWTPMSAALGGASQWAHSYLQSAPDEKVVIILLTDGDPHGCDPECMDVQCSIDKIAAIAGSAFINDGVLTYTVGLEGSNEADMDSIAQAGGTVSGFFISNSGTAEEELLAALQAISGQTVSCSFPMPEPASPDQGVDLNLVGIRYTPGGSGDAQYLPQVADGSECTASGGFYYDDPVSPTMVTLCPASCATVQADGEAVVDVAVGCECEVDADCPDGFICVDGVCIERCTCPPDMMCDETGHCVPRPGDPCEVDEDCPLGLVCIGGQCTEGGIFVGPYEAVQGGAFSCAVSQPNTPGRHLGLLLAAMMGIAVCGVARRRGRRR